jgi:membrane protein insertase Oxa1/YidC/SpoIIIJ
MVKFNNAGEDLMVIPEMTTNDTANLATIYGYVQNTATGGLFFPLTLLAVWIIAFIGSLSEGRQFGVAFIFSSFIISILSVPLVFMNMLSSAYMYFSFLMVGFGVLWMYLDRSPGI